jgi:MFS family permease
MALARTGRLVPRSFRVLRHRDFALVQVGNFVSNLGTWMQYVGLGWATRDLTSSTFVLGLTFAAQFGPSLVLSPISGVVADRLDRRRATMVGNALMAGPPLATALLIAGDGLTVARLLLLTTLGGVLQAMTFPASVAVVPRLVPHAEIAQAVSFTSAATNMARIAGPSIGGLAIRIGGVSWAFALNGLSFLAVVVAWVAVRPEGTQAEARAREPFFHGLREGVRYARRDVGLRRLLVLNAVLSLFVFHAPLMPVFARDVLDGGVSAYGVLTTATGVGAVLGACVAGELLTDRRRRGAIGVGAVLSSASLVLFAASRVLLLSAACLVAFGLGYFLLAATTTTVVMLAVEDDYRGRLMGLLQMASVGGVPIAGLVGGLLGSALGAPATVALGSSLMLAYALWFVASRALRHIVTERPAGADTGALTA